MDIATCMYHNGIDPFTGQEVHVAKGLRDRKMQRALVQRELNASRKGLDQAWQWV